MMARHAASVSAQTAAAPRAIRPGLLMALLVMLAATVWSLFEDDEPAPRRADRALRRDAAAQPAAAPSPSLPEGAREQRVEQLAQWAQRWQARGQIVALGETGHAAWISKIPPPPPPPPQAASSAPSPPPMAPPFPYQWIGRWQEQGAEPVSLRYLAVIAGPGNTWVVKAGDVIEGQWRIDAITDTAVRVIYLPLSQTQTLAMRRS